MPGAEPWTLKAACLPSAHNLAFQQHATLTCGGCRCEQDGCAHGIELHILHWGGGQEGNELLARAHPAHGRGQRCGSWAGPAGLTFAAVLRQITRVHRAMETIELRIIRPQTASSM